MLLIVPYGIETRPRTYKKSPTRLLIVPYGIETRIAEIVVAPVTVF